MKSFINRFPARREVLLLFMVCVFFVNIWSIIMFLRRVQSYIIRMPMNDVLGIFAYTQSFSLVESVFLLGVITGLFVIFPRKIRKTNFVAHGILLIVICFVWLAPLHYSIRYRIFHSLSANELLFGVLAVLWLVSFIVALARTSNWVRSSKLDAYLNKVADGLIVLSSIYILIDIICVFTILYRNLV